MRDILTATRIDPDGNHQVTRLSAPDDDAAQPLTDQHAHPAPPGTAHRYLIRLPDARTESLTAPSAAAAVAASRHLRTVSGRHENHYRRLAPDLLPRDDLLDALRPTQPTLDPEAWEDTGAAMFWPVPETAESWSTEHRVSVDDTPVYGITLTPRRTVLVPADTPERPHESWTDLFSASWDSASYAGVGVAGYGTNGLYLVRPGLLATVSMTDESYDLRLERVPRHARPYTLIRPRLDDILSPETYLPHLLLAQHGYDADDLRPGDTIGTCLDRTDLARLIRAVAPPTDPDRERR